MAIAGANDFINGPLADMGRSMTLSSRTKTVNHRGTESFSTSDSTITAVLHLGLNKKTQEKYGLNADTEGYIMTAPTTVIAKDDLITYENKKYLITAVVKRGTAIDQDLYYFGQIVSYSK